VSLNGRVWAPIGPSPIDQGAITANGQVTAIAVNPNDPNIIYIGTAWGGVWLTRDGGGTWTPLFDRAPALGVGEPAGIAIDPIDTSIIYVGTSNRDGSQFSGDATQPPAGLFKSTDGGGSWIRLGSGYPSSAPSNANRFFNQIINVVIVDPANHLVVYLASNSGVFVSGDGGLNWTQGVLPFGDVRSLVMDLTSPANARILYAGVSGRGVFRSNDGGQNWTLILSGATTVVANELSSAGTPGGPARGVGKFVVALAPPTSPPASAGIQVLYATIEGRPLNRPRQATDAPDPIGVFRSTDQGVTWTLQTPHNAGIPPSSGMPLNTQGGYSFHMAVDPASPGDGINDIIYFGAVGQARSTDSGLTFTALSGLHADTHAWVFAPQPGPFSVVYCGNDGGLFKGTGGTSFTSLNGGGLQTALFYNLDVKRDATASVTLGSLQDNGNVTTAGATAPTWKMGVGGDGFDVAHDGQNATAAYARSNANIFRSTDDGQSYGGITPPFSAAEANVYLAAVATDPSTSGGVYASSNQNLWQSTDGGSTWPKKAAIPGTASEVDVARINNNNVVVSVGGRVLVSTDAQGAFTLTDITRDLPGRFVGRVAFDPNDPATIYAVLGGLSGFAGGHVYRTSLTAAGWTDISPPLDLPFNAIALDGSETPTALYTGTDFGVLRSIDGGANWDVLDDIHFPGAPVFELVYHHGELRAATFGRGVFSFVKPAGPSIAVNLEDDLEFGTVCGGPQFLTLEVFNVGVADLVITSVQRLMGSTSFSVLTTPGTPLVIEPGEHVDFTVRFNPTTPAVLPEIATIRIVSNDPAAPVVDLAATGTLGMPRLVTAVANNGDFGNACLRSFVDRELMISNSGSCPLRITSIASSSPEFVLPGVVSYPLVLAAGSSVGLPVRFQPATLGPKAATLTIVSNDLGSPRQVALSGTAPPPELDVIVANMGNFGTVCVDAFRDLPLTLHNSGRCTLTIFNVASSSGEFVTPSVMGYPLEIAPGTSLVIPIRFAPTSFGVKSGTITITSDDPSGVKTVAVSGEAPSGRLVVTGSTCIGGVKECCLGERTIAICNVGECKLHVTSLAFKRKSRHWKLINNPFPATLHPGSCLSVLIRYKATERCPRACELVITSDDPVTPVKTLDVMAYTIPNTCGCSNCCEDCRKGCCCNKTHDACCSAQAIDGCCDEEGEELHDEEES
jgi:photosystem II stability/assembly factor-like uncharacterized protein